MEALYVGAGTDGRPEVAELRLRAIDAGVRVYDLAPGVLERVADTVTPQPLLAVLPMLDRPLAAVTGGQGHTSAAAPLVVVCADVRDPGNLGTVLRSSDAAGVSAVVCTGATVDPYNPKSVRASAGSLFHVPLVVEPDVATVLGALRHAGYHRLAAVVSGGTDYTAVDWGRPCALVLGNEAWGLPPEARSLTDGGVSIPIAGQAESLNVGVACAVLCFEALRQRQTAALATPSTIPAVPTEESP